MGCSQAFRMVAPQDDAKRRTNAWSAPGYRGRTVRSPLRTDCSAGAHRITEAPP